MTVAVCLNCGEMKTGAFAPCPSCGHHPVTLDDRAAHFISSSQCNTGADLERICEKVRRKEKLQFRPEDLAMIKVEMAKMQESVTRGR